MAQRPERRRADTATIVWPRGVEARYGVSNVTRYRWERDGKLPPRDVYVGDKAVGWRPETLAAAERGDAA